MSWEHGGDLVGARARTGYVDFLDFSINVNPLGLPEGVRRAVHDALEKSVSYPDPFCRVLRAALSARQGIPPEHILCGNGAADLLYRFAFAARPKMALLCAPTFSEYASSLRAAGCAVKTHALLEQEGFQLTERLLGDLTGVEALYLCNPNNPTGLPIPSGLLDTILSRCAEQGIRVLLDECFIGFLDNPLAHARIRLLSRYPNLVVLRAFTKLYAIPGLRLGYALCADKVLIEAMQSIGPPWNVSNLAQAAGIAALLEETYLTKARTLIQTERAWMKQALSGMGMMATGEANYLFFRATPGLPALLERQGILIRDCANYQGLSEGHVRVAIRTHAENERLISAIGRVLHGEGDHGAGHDL